MKYERIARILDWCKVNILLIERRKNFHFNEGEVWWCSVGMNIGEEEFGKGFAFERPVLVFKKFTKNSFLGLPLTSMRKAGSWYVPITLSGKDNFVMLNQARIFDKARLSNRVTAISDIDMVAIQTKFRELYCPEKLLPPPLEGEAGVGGKSRIVP